MDCNKHKYNSKREAQQAINDFKKHLYNQFGQRINRTKGKDDKKLQRSYYCDICECWHVTSIKKRNKFTS